MKTLLKSAMIVTVITLAIGMASYAQKAKPFKGMITYSISYSGNMDAATLAQQPKMITVSVLNNNQKMNLSMGPVSIDQISNGTKKESITLVDMMGQKKYFTTSTAEIEAEMAEAGTPVIKYLEETKTVTAYTCKKALFMMPNSAGETDTTVVYYTEELGGTELNYGSTFHGLKGFPLEYIIKQKGITVLYTATEVKKGGVKDADFSVPSDYVEYTADEKAQMKAAFKGQ